MARRSPSIPTAQQRELGHLLRNYRAEKRFTLEAVQAATGIDSSQLSRIERAERRPTIVQLKALSGLYGLAPAATEHLLAMNRESRHATGWWKPFAMDEKTATYVSLESEATTIKEFAITVIPGLFQTKKYATALVGQFKKLSDEQVAGTVDSRLARRQILEGDNGTFLHALVDEGVLWRTIGGPGTMGEQLEALRAFADYPNVVLQVLTFSAPPNPAGDGSFILLDFGEERDLPGVVYTEGQLGQTFQSGKEEFSRCAEVFDDLIAAAADPEQSKRIIDDRINAMN